MAVVAMAKLRFFNMRKSTTGSLARSSHKTPATTPSDHEGEEDADESGREPVVALTFVEDDLETAQAQADQAEADVIDAEALLELDALHIAADRKRAST